MKVTKSILKQMILEGIDEIFGPGDPRRGVAKTDISGLTHVNVTTDQDPPNVKKYTITSKSGETITLKQAEDYAHELVKKEGSPAYVDITPNSYLAAIKPSSLSEEVDENLLDIAKSAKNFIMPKKDEPLTADQALQQVQDILAAKELPTEKKLKAAHDFLMLNLYPKDAPSLVEKGEE